MLEFCPLIFLTEHFGLFFCFYLFVHVLVCIFFFFLVLSRYLSLPEFFCLLFWLLQMKNLCIISEGLLTFSNIFSIIQQSVVSCQYLHINVCLSAVVPRNHVEPNPQLKSAPRLLRRT